MSKIINKGKPFRINAWSNKVVTVRPDNITDQGELPIKVHFKTRNSDGQFILFLDSVTTQAMRIALDIKQGGSDAEQP